MPSMTASLQLLISLLLTLSLYGCTDADPRPHTYLKAATEYSPTALDDYISRVDPSYDWSIAQTQIIEDVTVQVVRLTSQTWQPPGLVDQPQWQHWLVISKPPKLESNTALLYISGGKSNEPIRKSPNENLARIAQRTGAITIELRAIPNQYLVFNNDNHRRKEDDLIAYTWARFLETGDSAWPAQLPMVKSVVRAMDTLQALHGIDNFVLAGGSKRGWTTWLTGAVDTRVKAMIPIVIDVLNVELSMDNHHAAYGYWSPAISDYVHHGIMDNRHSPNFAKLMALVDPYTYRQRFTQPKFLINAAGDEFFVPDSSRFYFDQLPGEKYLRYVPNAKHNLKGSDALESMEAYFSAFINQQLRPHFSWQMEEGEIRITAKDKPNTVILWQASNPEARDFRLDSIGKAWISTTLQAEANGNTYIGKIDKPAKGWTAAFIELIYNSKSSNSNSKYPLKFTTPVSITPKNLPFAQPLPDNTDAN